jgi:serine protease Do
MNHVLKGSMARVIITVSLLLMTFRVSAAPALSPDEVQALYERVTPSLVAVQYTWDSEQGRSELTAQGVVVGEEGVVMTSIALFPNQLADEQLKNFKIIVPSPDEQKELEAVFLGRDERSETAFVKTREKQSWKAIKFEDVAVKVGEPVCSIGLLPKEAAYKSYFSEATVAAVLRGPVPHVLVTGGGLTQVGSPVFSRDGKAIGFVPFQVVGRNVQSFLLAGSRDTLAAVNNPPRIFTPTRDFAISLTDPPTGEPLKLPWLGAQLSEVRKEVAEFYNLKNTPVAQVGEIIPDSPAAKAGLKPNDKIVKLNGNALERGDEPDETPRILVRQLRRLKPGEKVTLSVLRERDKPATDIEVTLEEQPRQANLAKRYYNEEIGLAVREIVFADTYAKKVAADTKGVVVAFIKPSSSAAAAAFRPGDIITELNKTPVKDLESFKAQLTEFRQKNPRDPVIFVVVRERGTEVIKLEPPQ